MVRGDWVLKTMAAVVIALYVALLAIQPGGEGWGYGWNVIGFLLYAVPGALLAGAVAAWRSRKLLMRDAWVSRIAIYGSVAFPLVAAIIARIKL